MRSLRQFLISVLFAFLALPAAATDLEEMVVRMAKIGFCGSPSFSPDGKRLAVICNLSGLPQVWTVSADGSGWPSLVTALDDQVSNVAWSPTDPDLLAFSLAPGGGLNEQVYVVRPDGQALRRITEGGKVNNQLTGWSPDGRLLLLGSNRADAGSVDSYVYDLKMGRLRLAAVNKGFGTLSGTSHEGRWGLVTRVQSRSDSNVYLVGLKARADNLLTQHQGPGNFGDPHFTDDSTVYLASDKDRDRIALARVKVDALGRPGDLEMVMGRDDADLDSFEVTRDGKTGALLWNVAGKAELTFLDLATGKPTPGPALPGGIVGGMTFSPDGTKLALTIAGSTRPADVWVLDRASNELRQVTWSPHAGVVLETLVTPELVTFPAHDGLELSGWLYRLPGETAPGSVVVSFHGGPEAQERPGFISTYQALLSRGISVFAPNVRGSAGFGKKFVNLDNGPLRFEGVKDIKDCVDYLVGHKIADPKRIGIMGGSYGGYMTLAGLTEFPDLFAAGADLFGIVNFETFFANTEPWMAAISTVEYGDPVTQKDLLASLSPIHKIDRIKAPTLVLHGANDTNVPVVEAQQVVETLKKRGVPVDLVLFPDEGHGFRKTPNRVRSTVATVEWFDKYLNAGRSPAPPPAKTPETFH
jgi:dipeptidyl aminopeptidase/acylaminoacyl peptidase